MPDHCWASGHTMAIASGFRSSGLVSSCLNEHRVTVDALKASNLISAISDSIFSDPRSFRKAIKII